MNFGSTFSISSLLYSILLIIIYFSKKRIVTHENNTYIGMMISNFFGINIAILCYYFLVNQDVFSILNSIFSKLYLIYVLTWITFFKTIFNICINLDNFFYNLYTNNYV